MVVATIALAGLLGCGCATSPAGPSAGLGAGAASPAAVPGTAAATGVVRSTPSAVPPATDSPSPSAPPPPPDIELEAQSAIDVPGVPGAIQIAVERDAAGHDIAVWTSGDGQAWRIDPATNVATPVPIDIGGSNWAGLVLADGDLWALDFRLGRILRMDPSTGELVATIDTPRPILPTVVPGGLWVAHELGSGISHVDVARNRIDKDITPAFGLGPGGTSIWFTRDTSMSAGRDAVEADAATGTELRDLPIPDGVGCSFFQDARLLEWTWCANPTASRVASIDLASGRVSSFAVDRSYVGGLIDAGGATWALVGSAPGVPASIVQLAPDGPTGVEAALPEGVDPDWSVMADGSLWIPSDSSGRVYRFSLEALRTLAARGTASP
jgi:hypothetical protein